MPRPTLDELREEALRRDMNTPFAQHMHLLWGKWRGRTCSECYVYFPGECTSAMDYTQDARDKSVMPEGTACGMLDYERYLDGLNEDGEFEDEEEEPK